MEYVPVDVAELMLAQATLQADCDIKGATGGDSASDTRHRDNGNVLHLNVSRRLGDEHETLVQEVQKTFVGLDRALDTVVAVVTDKVLGGHDNLLSGQTTENLGHDLVNRLFVVGLQLVFVLVLHEVPMDWLAYVT